ncbi:MULTISPECIES: hypothetical protein [unclassified Sporolactobacillus]|uniref:hypothetical protein n=1 Tax=unclassified Sporolactobacillus TaxID=2628533 RepID=UPI0023689D81|nr:hypothetical protein [Sporolactobacillus sp. CQH2019]MDD9148074.1 hypothetical protein [Sporolactobacillus sp. CQH2019]
MIFHELYEQTLAIKKLLDRADQTDREALIEKLQQLLDDRGKILLRLPRMSSNEDKRLTEKVADMNHEINAAMQEIKQSIINDMNQFRHRKHSVSRYRNPFQGSTKDGMFFDKKE